MTGNLVDTVGALWKKIYIILHERPKFIDRLPSQLTRVPSVARSYEIHIADAMTSRMIDIFEIAIVTSSFPLSPRHANLPHPVKFHPLFDVVCKTLGGGLHLLSARASLSKCLDVMTGEGEGGGDKRQDLK